jgi:hypothetical protein
MNFPGQHAIQSLDHTPHGPKMFFEKIFCFCLLHQLNISIEVSIGLSGILGFYCLLLSFAFEESESDGFAVISKMQFVFCLSF